MANGNGGTAKLYQIIGLMVVGMLSGGAGTLGYQKINPPRPDPFTGAMAREMEINLKAYIREQIETLRINDSRLSRIEASYLSEAYARRIFDGQLRGIGAKIPTGKFGEN